MAVTEAFEWSVAMTRKHSVRSIDAGDQLRTDGSVLSSSPSEGLGIVRTDGRIWPEPGVTKWLVRTQTCHTASHGLNGCFQGQAAIRASTPTGEKSANSAIRFLRGPALYQRQLYHTRAGAADYMGGFRFTHHRQHLVDAGKYGSLNEIPMADGMDLGQVCAHRAVGLAGVGGCGVESVHPAKHFGLAEHPRDGYSDGQGRNTGLPQQA